MFWQSVLGQTVLGIIVNIITVVLFALTAVALTARRWRRAQRHFFGLSERGASEMHIRVSNLWINQGGTTGNLPLRRGFVGSAITEGEFRLALQLSTALQTRSVARILGAVASQLGAESATNPITADVAACPPPMQRATAVETAEAPGCLILIGGPLYNSLTHVVMGTDGNRSTLVWMERGNPQDTGRQFGIYVPASRPGGDDADIFFPSRREVGESVLHDAYFVVEKLAGWGPNRATTFVCAGTGNAATAAAVHELAQWRRLRAEFGDGPFAVVFKLVTTTPNQYDSHGRVTREWHKCGATPLLPSLNKLVITCLTSYRADGW